VILRGGNLTWLLIVVDRGPVASISPLLVPILDVSALVARRNRLLSYIEHGIGRRKEMRNEKTFA